jgi:hypothetical protein
MKSGQAMDGISQSRENFTVAGTKDCEKGI